MEIIEVVDIDYVESEERTDAAEEGTKKLVLVLQGIGFSESD